MHDIMNRAYFLAYKLYFGIIWASTEKPTQIVQNFKCAGFINTMSEWYFILIPLGAYAASLYVEPLQKLIFSIREKISRNSQRCEQF